MLCKTTPPSPQTQSWAACPSWSQLVMRKKRPVLQALLRLGDNIDLGGRGDDTATLQLLIFMGVFFANSGIETSTSIANS
jgi:hypothetical protein